MSARAYTVEAEALLLALGRYAAEQSHSEGWKERVEVRHALAALERASATREPMAEVEQLRVQLAGCGAAALGATKEPAKRGDYGWSPSYEDVLNLRLRCDAAEAELARLRLVMRSLLNAVDRLSRTYSLHQIRDEHLDVWAELGTAQSAGEAAVAPEA